MIDNECASIAAPNNNECPSAQPSERPQYVVFAGVNGAGKSTLYQSGFWLRDEQDRLLARVNPDELLKEANGDSSSPKDQLKAGKRALELIDSYFGHLKSFNQETTLTGKSSIARLKHARELGYETRLYYVGLQDAQVAIERVRHRVETGGHNIDANVVQRRYSESIINFSRALDYCDEVRVFDNTQELCHVAAWRNGTLCWWGGSRHKGSWLLAAMRESSWRPESI